MTSDIVVAPTKTHRLPDGGDCYAVNALGYVPLLELADGTRLTEGRPSCNTSPTKAEGLIW